MNQLIIGGYNGDALSNLATEYNTLGGGFTWATSTSRRQVISTPGSFSYLSIKLSATPGGGGSYTIKLLNITQATSLNVVINDGNTTGVNSGTLNVVAGDVVQIESSYSGSPSNTPSATWSVIFIGDNFKESLILSAFSTSRTDTVYAPISLGTPNSNAVESTCFQIIPTNGKIKNLFVVLSADPGTSPDAYRITLRVNAANSDDGLGNPLQTTITADSTTGNDTTHEIIVAAGDRVDYLIEPLNTPATSGVTAAAGLTFVSDIDGESVILGSSNDLVTINATEFNNLSGTTLSAVWSGTESIRIQGGQNNVSIILKKLYVKLSNTSVGNYTFYVRSSGSGGNTTITCVVSAGGTTANDTANSYTLGSYDDICLSCNALGTARAVAWGLVCYIAPPGPVNIKSVNGLAIASVKSKNGLAMSNIKSINGLN